MLFQCLAPWNMAAARLLQSPWLSPDIQGWSRWLLCISIHLSAVFLMQNLISWQFASKMGERERETISLVSCIYTSRAGQAGGGSFQKEKNYKPKKNLRIVTVQHHEILHLPRKKTEFAYRMRTAWQTTATPKPLNCYFTEAVSYWTVIWLL